MHYPTLPRNAAQSITGLALLAAILCGWLALHVWAVFFFELSWATAPLAPVLMLAQCWLSVGLFIAAHDAMHGSLAPGHPRLNAAAGSFVLFLYAGFAWRRMRDAHFAHHRNPGTPDDPDFDAAAPAHFWAWYVTFLRRYFGWRSVAYISTVVTVYALVFRADPVNVTLFYGIPAIASSFQLFYFGTYRPHRHEAAPFVDAHNARTNDYRSLASLLTCFHFGYHHEHHLSPHLPWWRLPARHREARAAEGVA